jgi:hypothetical protein
MITINIRCTKLAAPPAGRSLKALRFAGEHPTAFNRVGGN